MQFLRRSPYGFVAVVSLVVGVSAVVGSLAVGVPLHDPGGFLGPAYVRLPLLGVLLFALGLVLAAGGRHRWRLKEIPHGMAEVIRYEWDRRRFLHVVAGLGAFYVCYVAYRNLKNVLPVYRDGVLYDRALFNLDKWLFGGTSPALILHDLLGVDIAAQVLSTVYLAYMPLVPISLGIFLVLSRNLAVGAWYATTLSLNWVMGAVSYYILPALGPIYARPDLYAVLPETGVGDLQQALMENRMEFLTSPATSEAIHGVAAFASLHVSVTFAAALFISRMGYHRMIRIFAWTFFALTFLATLYFGWHYLLDNVAGMAIGYATVSLGAWASGCAGFGRRSGHPADVLEPAPEAQLPYATTRGAA